MENFYRSSDSVTNVRQHSQDVKKKGFVSKVAEGVKFVVDTITGKLNLFSITVNMIVELAYFKPPFPWTPN